jgi:hypothetical protein
VLAVFNLKAHILARSAVGFEFVGDHDARRFCRLPQKFAHEPSRVGLISSALNQDVENEAVLIDGAPEPMLVATDCDDDFVETPFIATNRGASTNAIGKFSAEFLRPMANGLMAHLNATSSEHFLNHPQLKGKRKWSQTV